MRLLRYLIVCIAATLFAAPQAHSAVYWEFQLAGFGGYKAKHYGEPAVFHAGTGINLFIPVSHRIPLLIETGLHYRVGSYQFEKKFRETYYYEDGDKDISKWTIRGESTLKHGIQIPLKLNYEYGFNDNTSLRFGLGAFTQFNFGKDNAPWKYDGYGNELEYKDSPFSVGINPSVVLSHRCVSFGVSYEGTLYNPQHNRFNHAFMFTFGLKFKSHVWKYIGMGVGAAAMVAGGVGAAYMATQGKSTEQVSSSDSGNTEKSKSKDEVETGKQYDLSEQQSFRSDDRTYHNYETMVIQYYAGTREATEKEKNEWQAAMKKIRLKWKNRGKTITKSIYEDK